MRTGEILQGYCAAAMNHSKSIDPESKAELVLTPKFYKYTVELLSINPKVGSDNFVGSQSDYVCVDNRWLYLPFLSLLASLVYLTKALLKQGAPSFPIKKNSRIRK
jgi:hypothetical protein